MAQAKKNRPFLWVIMILLFVGLLGFGVGGFGGTIRSIGSVGDKEIDVVLYQRQLNQQVRALSAQLNAPVGFQQAQALGVDQAVLQQLITRRTLDNEATNLGLSVGDARVRAELLQFAEFRDLNGTFNRDVYTETLRRNNQTEAGFETTLRESLTRTLLQSAVLDGIPAPSPYADALVQFIGETRDIVYAPITADDLDAPVPGPTEDDITAYYTNNIAAFMRPESRDITYVWLTPAMIQDQLEVDQTALQTLYDERVDEFVQPERRLVERLAFVDAAKAEAAMARVDAGEVDFDTLVSERGLTLADVDLGDVSQADLRSAGDAVFAAATGDIVGPLNTALGPALFRVNAVLAAEVTTFEEAVADLREELATQRAIRVIDDASEGINDLMAGGARLEDLAEQTDMVLGTIAFSSETTDDIAAYDNFRDAAVGVEQGAFPELLRLSDGGIFALRLDSVTPPTERPLDEVRADVIAGWMAEKTQEMVLEKANSVAADISPLTGFDTLALAPVEADLLTRNGFLEGTPQGFMAQVFEMDLTEVRVIDAGDRALIVRLDRLAPPDAEDPQTIALKGQVAASASGGIQQDLFDAFAAAVQRDTEVTINQSAINQVHTLLQ